MKTRLVCALTLVVFCGYGQTCQRPDGSTGICVIYSNCPEIVEKLNSKEKTPDLREYTCGVEGKSPKVCCNDCYTPEGKLGKCKQVNTCPHLSVMQTSSDKNIREFLSNSRCLTGPSDVCCGPSPGEVIPSDDCNSQINAFPPHPASKCCGYDASTPSKIIGGTDTSLDQYPWTVLLEYEETDKSGRVVIKTYCGGSLISNKYVLTAAHCITGDEAWPPKNVRLGEYDTRNETDCVEEDCADPIIVIPIEEITVHPGYGTNQHNDIALIRMTNSVAFTEFVRPICLPSSDVSWRKEPLEVIAAGWGRINNIDMTRSPIKQHVRLPLFKFEDCINSYQRRKKQPNLWNKQLCAGGEPGKDSCKGDSGGPLMLKTGLFHELVGVVSYGANWCGTEGLPGIYTNVRPYTTWIRALIRP